MMPRIGSVASLLKAFAPDLRAHGRTLGAAYLMELVTVAAAVTAPWPLKVIIDQVLGGAPLPAWAARLGIGRDGEVLLLTGGFLLLIGIGAWAASVSRVFTARARERITVALRDRLVTHLQTLPPTIRTEHRSGELVLRLVGDTDMFVRLLAKTLPLLFRFLATAVATIGAMFWMAPRLGLLGILALPAFVLMVRHYGPRLTAAARRKRRREGEVAAYSQEIVRGLPVIQALGGDRRVRRLFGELNARTLAAGVAETRIGAALERALELARGLAVALVTAGGALLVLRGRLTVGELTVLCAYTNQLLKPAEKINDLAEATSRGLAAGERLLSLLALRPLVEDAPGARELTRTRGRIEARGLCFSYPDPHGRGIPVLRGVDLTLEPGRLTVLIGRSGAGKSTLVNLLVRIFDPTSGSLTLDGLPYAGITLRSLRGQIGVMAQDLHLFSGTLRDALAVGESEPGDDRLWEALALVAMADFVRALPNRLDTLLGEDGLNLSGGQRQRLSLARAFLTDRPVLLLDEPLANVDAVSAGIILEALRSLKRDRACLAITHQPELLAHADVIYRLEDGRLMRESTTPSQLVEAAG